MRIVYTIASHKDMQSLVVTSSVSLAPALSKIFLRRLSITPLLLLSPKSLSDFSGTPLLCFATPGTPCHPLRSRRGRIRRSLRSDYNQWSIKTKIGTDKSVPYNYTRMSVRTVGQAFMLAAKRICSALNKNRRQRFSLPPCEFYVSVR